MRIVIDARYLDGSYSGIAQYSLSLIEHLAQVDTENQYVVIVHSAFNRRLKVGENFEVVRYGARPVSLKTLFRFGRRVKRFQPDLLHSLFPLTPLFCSIPQLITVHDLQPLMVPAFTGKRPFPIRRSYDLFYRWAYPRSLRHARWLIAVSRATKDDITANIPDTFHKTVVVHSGVEEVYQEPVEAATIRIVEKRFSLPKRFCLYLGSTRPNKNLLNIIRAFDRVINLGPAFEDLEFVMVLSQDRFFEDCRRLIRRLNLGKQIRILDPISEEEKRALYNRATLLCQVTRNEGFGFPVLEAQASGLPVLAADHAALPEVGGKGALYVDPGDVGEIADGLQHLIESEPLRQQLIEEGKRNASRFSWKKTALRVLEIYRLLY